MSLAAAASNALAEAEQIERLESAMLELPQVDCPVEHFFGPGLYIRQVTLPAGALVVGHAQRFEHLNVMLAGAVVVATGEGVQTLRAPLTFVGRPGRKVGFVLETVVWQNIYATDERDVEKLEAMFLDKSGTSSENDAARMAIERLARQEDRDDFAAVIAAAGFSPETVRAQSENTADQCAMPPEYAARFVVRASAIDGRGAFLSAPAAAGELIAPARLGGLRTPAGRYTNHSKTPNAHFVMDERGDVYLMASRAISGCTGGSHGEEVTVDYRQALALSGIEVRA